MKPILPKSTGVPHIQGIFASPRTTIILAPAGAAGASPLHLGTSFSSPLILPAPPTPAITLAAHRVPQPTPVILPVTKSTASSSNIQLQCPLLAPKNFLPRIELKNQQPATICLNGKRLKRHLYKKNKERRDGKQIQSKYSSFETPILPKRSQSDPQTVILLPSVSGKAVGLHPPVLVPKCSLVISDMHSHATLKEGKKTKGNDSKDCAKKQLSKVKKVYQEKLSQSNNDKLNKSAGNNKRTVRLKFAKKKHANKHSITLVDETKKMKPSDIHQDGVREGSSLLIAESANSMYSPESFILSAEGYLNESGHFSHQQDIPHHPPPPYPQDSLVDVSSSSENTEAKQDPNNSQENASEPETDGPNLFHLKRKKCEWKHKRHSVAERLSRQSSSVVVPEMKSDFSSKITDAGDSHIPPSPSSPLVAKCAQSCTTPSSSSILAVEIPIGNTCTTDTTVTSSCSSSVSHSHSSPSKNRNMSPSLCKSHAYHKGPSYEPHTPIPTSSPSLDDAQVLLLTPGKSPQNKSCEQSYPLPASSGGVSLAGVPSGSSQSSELSSPQPVSHTLYCSQTSVVAHLSQSPASSLSHETNTSIPSCGGAASYEPKSGATAVPSQAGLQFNLNTQRAQSSASCQLDVCDQAPSSAFYFQPPQCNTSLHSDLHSHSSIPCIETNSANTISFPSYMPSQDQIFIHKVTSTSSSYTDSSQPSSYAETLQPTPYMDPPHPNSYSQSSQPKLITKSPHLPHMPSNQLPSYTQSSRSLSHTQSTQAVMNTMPDHSTSHACSSPSAAHGHSSQTFYTEGPHTNPHLNIEPYLQPTQPHPLCGESQHEKTVSDHHSHSQPSHTAVSVESLTAIPMFKDHSQSPVLPMYAASHNVSSSQCYTDSSNIPYTSRQTNAHDPHYYSLGRLKALTSSSVDPTSSHLILEKSLNPPSYEAHIQNAASYIASESDEQVTHDHSQHSHHQTSPANYSLSCQIIQDQGTQSLHEDAKKIVNSDCSSPPSLLPLTSSSRYTYNQQLTHVDPQIDNSIIADIAQGTYDYDIEESSQTYFPSTTPDAQLSLPAESQPPNTVEYSASHSLHESHSTSIHTTSRCVQNRSVQPRLQSSQSRVLVYPLARQESLYNDSDQDDTDLSSWSSTARNTGHGESVRFEKLLFIPHSEQTRFYMKKESSKNLPNDPGQHLSRDMMLKKFWIEEDEPIAEEIVSSLPSRLPPPQTSPSKQEKAKARQMLCQICGKMLRGRNSLRCHLNSHHNIQPHTCSTCGKSFTNRNVLVEHLRIHSGETPYPCSLCDAAFRTRSGLLRHGSMHTTARPHECSMCSKKFKTKLVLQQHMKLHLTDIFTCSDCGKTFERHKSLAIHKAFHHHKTQRFPCPHCHKGYHFQTLLNHHMQLHSNVHKHICSVCGKSFVWRSGLAAHMKTHSTSRPKCDICDLSFASEKRLQSHYQHHSNPKPQCKVCGRSFSHAYRLASHALIHQEHKEYICHKCDIVFTNAKKFRKHLVTHKKEEPRICRLSGTVEVSKPVL